uniref:TBC1 domain family member 10A n=2 Tax=Schistocephalus solidus TaxID=70667 RepID=A0A0X3NJ89_SCHSO
MVNFYQKSNMIAIHSHQDTCARAMYSWVTFALQKSSYFLKRNMNDEIHQPEEDFAPMAVDEVEYLEDPALDPPVDRYGFIGGQQYTDPSKAYVTPIDVIRNREKKWMSMCKNWDYWTSTGKEKLRERCRKGIPDSMRCEAWQRLVQSPALSSKQGPVIIQEPPKTESWSRGLLRKSSRLNGSHSLPTVIATSPNLPLKRKTFKNRNLVKDSSVPSPGLEQRKHSSAFGTFRRIGSFFRLNANNNSKSQQSNSGTDTCSVGGGGGEGACGHIVAPPAEHRVFDAHMPSAAYLGIPLASESNTSTVASIDASSLTTSSNFFSAEDSSCGPSIAGDDDPEEEELDGSCSQEAPRSPSFAPSSLSPPALASSRKRRQREKQQQHSQQHERRRRRRLWSANGADDGESGEEAGTEGEDAEGHNMLEEAHRHHAASGSSASTAYSSHFSTMSSRASSTSSPPLSLQSSDQPPTMAVVDRDRTLVAPVGANLSGDFSALYEHYVAMPGDPACNDQIQKDIHRQFPFHELFCDRNSHGRESLYNVLKAYTLSHPGKGYCQGQAPLAAVLLMFMPEADAFWTFNKICDTYLEHYYDEGLDHVQIDGYVLFGLLKRVAPPIYKFLVKNGVDPVVLVLEWFMCVYTRTLPWESVLRVLDMFFCEGKIVIFKVGLVLLERCFGSSSYRKSCEGLDDVIMRAQDIPSKLDNPEELVQEMSKLSISRRQVANEIKKQSSRWFSRMEAVTEASFEK